MLTRFPKTIEPVPGKENVAQEGAHDHGDTCRCQETSKMRPRQLLRLMISDLAFWKKAKKG